MPTESARSQSPAADILHRARVLVADDQPDVLQALRLLLKGEGGDIETATSPAGGLSAVEARDFDVALIDEPWHNERVPAVVRPQVQLGRALRRSQRLEAENTLLRDQGTGRPNLIAESAAMQPVLELIARVGPSDANVLLTGENGTGKGTVAQAIHAVSTRAGKPLMTVNAGGLSEGVFESELFGHVKGAFTDAKADRVGRFELADGGTLFLDEI